MGDEQGSWEMSRLSLQVSGSYRQDGNFDDFRVFSLFLRKNRSQGEPVFKSLHYMWAAKGLQGTILGSLIELLCYCSFVLTA